MYKVVKQALIVLSLGLTLPATAIAENYTIGTGSQSGTYYPFGGTLAKIWNENIPGFAMRAEVTAASVENIIKVSSEKQLVGIAMGNVVQKAHQGEQPFPRQMPANVLFALYPNVVQFIVPADSDVQSVTQLKGKKVSLGAPGSGTRVSAQTILTALGINEDDIEAQSLNYTATTSAIANNQIDAGVIVGSLGVGAITELALTRDIRILSFCDEEIAKISEQTPAYQKLEAPADSYNNVPAFNAPAVWNVLVASEKMSDEMAYNLTKTAFENIDKVRQAVGVARFTTVENMNKLSGVPLHPGAQKYFDEHAK